MGFEAPVSIREAIGEVLEGRWVIPAFQRSLVWKPEKMQLLFDSLMRDYPIGSFLLWELEKPTVRRHAFFDFVREYHAKDRRAGGLASLRGRDRLRGVIDGQQRLSALLIGLHGSHADRVKYGRHENPAAWPRKRLYLNLHPIGAQDGDTEDRSRYRFRFLTDAQAKRTTTDFWFPVPDAMDFRKPGDASAYLVDNDLAADETAHDTLFQLRHVVWDDPRISYYLERDQDFHKVVTIYQRLNKAGTPLTTGEIVFSTAVEQWQDVNARQVIDDLVVEMNSYGKPDEFHFSRDHVLKSCLVLSDVANIRFEAGSFGSKNMARIEEQWATIANSLRLAARLLGSLGYNGSRLTSHNAAVPIAYHLHALGAPHDYVDHPRWQEDRSAIRRWLASVLVRRTFSGHSDSKLTAARRAIREQGGNLFPGQLIERRLNIGTISEQELDALLSARYGLAQGFAVLSLLYANFPYDRAFDIDHIHPRSFTKTRLLSEGMTEADADFYLSRVNEIPNLQLLPHEQNNQKLNAPFEDYLSRAHRSPEARRIFLDFHRIRDGDLSTAAFRAFFDSRKALIAEALRAALAPPSR